MERRKITVPAAGEISGFDIQGQSVVFEVAGTYETPDDVPQLAFNGRDPVYPIYELGTIPFYGNGEKIKQVRIKGTAASAGSDIWILAVDECLPFDLKPKFLGSFKPRYPVNQFTKVIAGAAVVTLNNLELQDPDGNLPAAAYISASGFDIRYAYGVDPTATLKFDLLTGAENPTKLDSLTLIKGMRFANVVTDGTADATLNILPEFIG